MPILGHFHSLGAAADVESLAFNWAFGSKWLVLLAVAAAGVMIFYLYRAQQRIASRRLVVALTAIRLVLIGLMFVLLAAPVYQRRHSRELGGTLWLLVDQSMSMDQVDRQMTPVECLHWAEALGVLPANLRSSLAPSRDIAQLTALRAELVHQQNRSQISSPDDDAQRIATFTKQLQVWHKQLHNLAERLSQDASTKGIGDTLRAAAQAIKSGLDKSADRPDFQTAAADIPWAEALKTLDAAIGALKPLSD